MTSLAVPAPRPPPPALQFILTAIGYLSGANWNRAHTFECVGFGVIGQFFGLASCSWFMMIAINVWCMLMYPFTYKTAKHLWKYHAWYAASVAACFG